MSDTVELRIYYEDSDAQGVVFYANYLKYFERARTEFLRQCDYLQNELLAKNIIFIVNKLDMSLINTLSFRRLEINRTLLHNLI